VSISWTSNSAGTASDLVDVSGQIVELITVADSGSSGLYSLRLLDPTLTDVDYLAGLLVQGCTSDVIGYHEPLIGTYTPPCVMGDVVFQISDAGNALSGDVIIFLKS